MAIIISKNNKDAEKLDPSGFDFERSVQKYILENPNVIPLYEINEGARLFIAAREFPAASGAIDALGFDEVGNIYVIEIKLHKNTDKRKVVAQALDYGASLWKNTINADEFIGKLNSKTQEAFNKDFATKIAEFFELDDAQTNIEIIKNNLTEGNIRFLVVMDKLEESLKDLILYINQNSKFDIYAVELEYYKHDEFEIVIPKIFGNEVKKDVVSASGKQSNVKWDISDEVTFLDSLEEYHNNKKLKDEAYKAIKELMDIYTKITKNVHGRITYHKVSYQNNKEVVKIFFNDSNDKIFFCIQTDGYMTAHKYGRSGPQINFIDNVLNNLIKHKIFDKGNWDLDGKYDWYSVNLCKSNVSKKDIVNLVSISRDSCQTAFSQETSK